MSSPKRPPRPSLYNGEGKSPLRKIAASPSSSDRTVGGLGKSEAIQVAIRLRPLNTNESGLNTVWKVLPKYNSIAQTTKEGKPMPESVQGKNFFTYDKVFGESSTTKDVYDSVAKGIVGSACNGIHGTIFAYGQTSSGKTFTMQGSGTIEEGAQGGGGGIVHMAASEIFEYISRSVEREFAVRASFVEIYNEEVRDLLSPESRILQIREDPVKGVFVEAEETPVHDFKTLLNILFQGDKSRKFATTAMNERSSRSHTIFRITIESKQASGENKANDGAIQVSTLNLVDLAGSESVRHTGATGDRQVEGGMINRSLLTLSRVIVSLGNQGQTHINFRDSKLTRLLQPSLSGNARMAVICCATPSELYLEETRSTLAFASRAKLVKTNAQVNEVISDQTRIRRLLRENAALKHALSERLPMNGAPIPMEDKQSGRTKLKRVASALLNAGPDIFDNTFSADLKRRRHSYGAESFAGANSTPLHTRSSSPPFTETKSADNINFDAKLQFRDEVVSAKTSIIDEQCRLLDERKTELSESKSANNTLTAKRDEAEQAKKSLQKELQEATLQLEAQQLELQDVFTQLEQKQGEIKELQDENTARSQEVKELKLQCEEHDGVASELNMQLKTNTDLQESNTKLHSELEHARTECEKTEALLKLQNQELQELRLKSKVLLQEKGEAETSATEASEHLLTAKRNLDHLQLRNEELEQKLDIMGDKLVNAEEKILALEAKADSLIGDHTDQMADSQHELSLAKTQIDQLQDRIQILDNAFEEMKVTSASELKESEEKRLQLTVELDQKSARIKYLEESVAAADETIADKVRQIGRSEEISNELSTRVVNLEDRLKSEKARSEGLDECLAAEKIKVQALTENVDFQNGKMEEHANENALLRHEQIEQSKKLEDLQKVCDILKREYDQSVKQCDLVFKEEQYRNERLSQRLTTLGSVLSFVSSNADAIEQTNNSIQSELMFYKRKLSDVEAQLIQAEATLSATKSNHRVHMNSIEAQLATLAFVKANEEACQEELSSIREHCSILREEKSALHNRAESAESRITDLEAVESDKIRFLESELAKTTDECMKIRLENDHIKSVSADVTRELQDLKEEHSALITKLQFCEAKSAEQLEAISELQREAAILHGENDDLRKAREAISTENATREKNLRESADRLNEEVKNSKRIQEILASVSGERDDLKAALDVAEHQLAKNSLDADDMKSLKQENVSLKAALAETTTEFNAAQESIQHLRASIIKSAENESRIAEKVTHLQGIIDSRATAANSELQKQLEMVTKAKQEIVTEAEAKMKELRTKLSSANDAKASFEKEAYICRQMKEELQDQVDVLENERKVLSKKSEDLEQSMSALQDDLKVMKSELVVSQDHSKTLQRNSDNQQKVHQREVLRLEQVIQMLKTANQTTKSGSQGVDDSEKKKLASENAELMQLLQEKDKRILKLSKSKLTERHIETMKQYKSENESYKAEIELLKSQLAATKTSSTALVKSNTDLVPTKQCDLSTLQELQFAKQATETKYSKLKSDYQDLQSERRQAVDALKSSTIAQSLFEANGVDLVQAITVLCDKVTSSDTSGTLSAREEESRSSLANAETAKIALQMELNKALKQDAEKARLLDSKDREMGYLQKENLHLMNRLNEARKERDEFKKQARSHVGQPHASATKYKADLGVSSAKSPRRPPTGGKSAAKSAAKPAATDKENSADLQKQTPSRSSSKRQSSAMKPLSKKKSKHIEEELHAAFGAPCDEHTENCKQS